MRSLSLLAVAASYVAVVSAAGSPVTCQLGTFRQTSNNLCYWCDPGTFSSSSTRPSNVCPNATTGHKACGNQIVNGVQCYGATAQTDCGSGSYQSNPGQSICTTCPPGYRCPSGPQTSPTACGNGSYQPNSGQSACITCPVGNKCPNGPQTSPTACSPGDYQNATGANNCKECEKGEYNNAHGATKCCKCCAGTYQNDKGKTTCKTCPIDRQYSAPGSDSSTDCKTTPIQDVTISNKLCTIANPPEGFPIGQGYCYPEQGGPVNSGIHINKRSLKCAKGLTRCPHLSGKGGFDCINTRTDPESCGGCVNIYGDEGEGKDCTAIPNVSVTRCVKGKCVIKSCAKRHALSDDGTSCEPADQKLHSQRRKRHAALKAPVSHRHVDV